MRQFRSGEGKKHNRQHDPKNQINRRMIQLPAGVDRDKAKGKAANEEGAGDEPGLFGEAGGVQAAE